MSVNQLATPNGRVIAVDPNPEAVRVADAVRRVTASPAIGLYAAGLVANAPALTDAVGDRLTAVVGGGRRG